MNTTQLKHDFLTCGMVGCLMEFLFTGLKSLFIFKQRDLKCHSSLWMFPIYGMACFIKPFKNHYKNLNILKRGLIYTILIFIGEFISGSILKKFDSCPWDYSDKKHNVKGLIRLDYAPCWFLAGLIFEQILKKDVTS
jgi:uncharacterized membrane protein